MQNKLSTAEPHLQPLASGFWKSALPLSQAQPGSAIEPGPTGLSFECPPDSFGVSVPDLFLSPVLSLFYRWASRDPEK